MSVKAMSWVWEHSNAGGNDRLVLLAIADSADHDGENAWPSISTIAAKCSLSTRTVQRCIQSLVELGELEVAKQQGGSDRVRADRRPNRYRVPMGRGDSNGVTERHPDIDGVTAETNGVTERAPRGDNAVVNGVTLLSPKPSLIHPEPVLEPSALAADLAAIRCHEQPRTDFDRFWSVYPWQKSKGTARTAWFAALKKADAETIIDGAQRYRDDPNRNPSFTQKPENWLAGEGWNDTPATGLGMSRSAQTLRGWSQT